MRIVRNTGNDTVGELIGSSPAEGKIATIITPQFSVFAFETLQTWLERLNAVRLLLTSTDLHHLALFGGESETAIRNQLRVPAIAKACAHWIEHKADIKLADAPLPQSLISIADESGIADLSISGACSLTSEGIGRIPGNRLNLIQASGDHAEAQMLQGFADEHWQQIPPQADAKSALLTSLRSLFLQRSPEAVYFLTLYHLFADLGTTLDESQIIKKDTGYTTTKIWNKLYKFQKDGVLGAIDKLERLGGCIIADSVGLGKTFEALAVIKYYELRNDRVLVLCPKRLRDNWVIYKSNDKRNILADDRLNYDVLSHTDLLRENGTTGDMDLAHVHWGNYDLLVIDESHNFRNKRNHRNKESRYERLMNAVIRQGVKTKVLMLSATPVNNRLADLKNQIAFVAEGRDEAFSGFGIQSLQQTLGNAQYKFNRWLELEEHERSTTRLLDMLGFDYFKLLDLLTIARSRKHVEKYYGIAETGRFPERLRPINHQPDIDVLQLFPSIHAINLEILRLRLAAHAPLKYILPHKEAEYNRRYSQAIRGQSGYFRQADREDSLVNLMRVNILKRMESSVNSFALTVERQLADVEKMLSQIDSHNSYIEELDINNIEIDDPAFEPLLIGKKVKVLLQDVDKIRWRQDLLEDRNRLEGLAKAARVIDAPRDQKLLTVKEILRHKANNPINKGNRKVLLFTAFADTAEYLYDALADWAKQELGMQSACLVGSGRNRSTIAALHHDFTAILSAFSPRSKERPSSMDSDGQIDLLIATDCISEGQNLQDCDYLINYDIHWNPVRIIQRFGRIDRLGSINQSIQMVNFWPNMELEEYIQLEKRVSGRMVLLDISATGEENLIEAQSGNQMNDLEYRRNQLLKLQQTVIDMDDLGGGISITDLTLNDFRMDLMQHATGRIDDLNRTPLGAMGVVRIPAGEIDNIQPGIVFCLRAVGPDAAKADPHYPLMPHYLVHVGDTGSVVLPYSQPKPMLDMLKRLCFGHQLPDTAAIATFGHATAQGWDMTQVVAKLKAAIDSIRGKRDEKAIASLFTPGGTEHFGTAFKGQENFEVVTYLVILPSTRT
jgi:hypothetical protein